ncbi:GDSL-type esterase/lipase family protein [Desulforamulus ruminis]|uniref:GDSL-type esterase/lipase family protein n=1 Tax=Desulforamulus ruminis TaxID=1564 RepID=UPI002FDAF8E7
MIRVVQAEVSLIGRYLQQGDKEHLVDSRDHEVDGSYEDKIRSATSQALQMAESKGLNSLGLPVIPSGKQRMEPDRVARTMVSEVRRQFALGCGLRDVTFMVENEETMTAFRDMLNRTRIVCLGDSITYGYPEGPDFSWVAVVQRATGHTFVNRGVNGETTGQMLARFHRDVVPEAPAYMIFLGGHNDGWQKVPFSATQQNITTLTGLALEEGICPVLGLPSPLNLEQMMQYYQWDRREAEQYVWRLDQIRQWIAEYASARGILTLDFYTPLLSPDLKEGDPKFLLDGGHPTREGYRILGQSVTKQWLSFHT